MRVVLFNYYLFIVCYRVSYILIILIYLMNFIFSYLLKYFGLIYL